MPDFIPKRGTILVVSGTAHDPSKQHLLVVCTDPCPNRMQVLVPICTIVNSLVDQSCLLKAGEHPFIRRPSYVLYRYSRIELQDDIVTGVQEGAFLRRPDMNGQTFLRIKSGICRSSQAPRKVKRYLGCPGC